MPKAKATFFSWVFWETEWILRGSVDWSLLSCGERVYEEVRRQTDLASMVSGRGRSGAELVSFSWLISAERCRPTRRPFYWKWTRNSETPKNKERNSREMRKSTLWKVMGNCLKESSRQASFSININPFSESVANHRDLLCGKSILTLLHRVFTHTTLNFLPFVLFSCEEAIEANRSRKDLFHSPNSLGYLSPDTN